MAAEPTSILMFRDLILEIALKMGVAYYGQNGDEEAQIPVDKHDLIECKRHANNAVRMFISDAPPTGWKWTRTIANTDLWPDVLVNAAVTITGGSYDPTNDQTLITANTDVFYDTMEEKLMAMTGHGSAVVKQYVSPTTVYVHGSHGFADASTFSIDGNGQFPLPRTFAGTHTGKVTYAAGTNRGLTPDWCDAAQIRALKETTDEETGQPYLFAIRPFPPNAGGRVRFSLDVFPVPNEHFVANIPYDLYFDKMVSLTETLPTPLIHDETLKAACLAIVEKDVDRNPGADSTYYREICLPNSWNADARSGPRRLGYFGNPQRGPLTVRNFRDYMRRPNVDFQP